MTGDAPQRVYMHLRRGLAACAAMIVPKVALWWVMPWQRVDTPHERSLSMHALPWQPPSTLRDSDELWWWLGRACRGPACLLPCTSACMAWSRCRRSALPSCDLM